MGTNYNPRIVTNGLVLCLDAANRKSYPGSGTTSTDLSGSGSILTLTNGPTYSTNNGGHFSFDGVNDYAILNNNSIADNLTSMTVSVWVYRNWNSVATNSLRPIITKISDYGAGAGWDLNCIPRVTNPAVGFFIQKIGGANYNQVFGNATNNPFFPTGLQWINLVAVYSGGFTGTISMYINSRPLILTDSSFQKSGIDSISTTASVCLASRNGGAADTYSVKYLDCSISDIQIYNRALSAAEVQQNFNATRGRYGI